MPQEEAKKPGDKAKFSFCPQCGRKGLYHIRQQYYRCRYCGTYMIPPAEKKEP
jgi:ribosomal protein L37AE/L43A